jgi:DNA-binding transcriptional LysR family regulator
MQYQINHADLSLVLALERGRSLAKAAELLKVDVSTVFRSIRRLESALGTALFVKSRKGYLPTDTAQALAEQAERAEQALDAARIALTSGEQVVSGTVRLTCTEAVLHSCCCRHWPSSCPTTRRFRWKWAPPTPSPTSAGATPTLPCA